MGRGAKLTATRTPRSFTKETWAMDESSSSNRGAEELLKQNVISSFVLELRYDCCNCLHIGQVLIC